MEARGLVAVGFDSWVSKMFRKVIRLLSPRLSRERKIRSRLIDSVGRCRICRLSSAFLSRLEAVPRSNHTEAAYNLEKFM
jgi:hypothetical protein